MKNLLISVSGGRSSAVMAHKIATSKKYKDFNKLFVFANTGKEREETLTFLLDLERIIKQKNSLGRSSCNYAKGDRYRSNRSKL